MAKPISNIGRFSSLASDPLRSFKFYAEFVPAQNDQSVFSEKILDSKGKDPLPTNGVSSGFVGGFTQIDGLMVQIQEIAYREGGFNTTAHYMPGMAVYSPVTFQRGVLYGNDQAMTWVKGLTSVLRGDGLNPVHKGAAGNFRVNINIYVAAHPHTGDNLRPRMRFTLNNAFITQLNYSTLNSVNGELLFETMSVRHEGMTVDFVDYKGNPVSSQSSTKKPSTGSAGTSLAQ